MADEVAFFQFRNNADETAADIAAAMRRINSSLSQPLGKHDLSLDIGGMGQSFKQLEDELARGKQRVNSLIGQLGSGAIDRRTFETEWKKTVSSTVGNIPTILADTLARAPEATAMRTPARELATQFANEYVQTMLREVRGNRDLAGGLLRGVQFRSSDFANDIGAIGTRPVAYGNETSAISNLINRVRAENLVRSDVGNGPDVRAKAANAGILGLYDDIRKQTVQMVERGEQIVPQFVPTGAAQELSELVRREREAEQTARRLGTARERTARQTEELAAAEQLLQSGYTRVGGGLIDPKTGQPFRRTTDGVTPLTNPVDIDRVNRAQESLDDKRANSARLKANYGDVFSLSPTLKEYEGVYYRLTKLGAERVQDEALIKSYQEQQYRALERQQQRANRLNEYDGKALLKKEQGNSGVLGGFVGRFQRGDQSIATGLGGQIASAAAFSFAYGSLFALQGALRDTMHEFLDYQDSVTDLEVATRNADVVTGDWVNSLSELSRLSGSNVGAAIDAAARGVRAFTNGDSSPDEVKAAGDATAKAANRLALIANKSLTDATGDVIASGSAFGLRPDQLEQVVDAVSNAKRNVGGDAAQISQGLSLIALSAQEAGFNLNEAAAVIGLVQARTDQSGQAIATRLTRIFQIVQGSTGRNLARELADIDPTRRGILSDPTSSVKDRLETFAKIYAAPDTTETTRNRIASGLGGTANLRELLPLLKEGSTLQDAYRAALENTGQGTDEFNRKTDNLVGTLKKIAGDISNLQVGLGKSGIFDFAGIALKGIEPAIYGISSMVNAYDELTSNIPGLQTMVGLTLDLVLAAKALGAIQIAGGILGGGSKKGQTYELAAGGAFVGHAGFAARDREAALILQAAERRMVAEGRYDQVVSLAAGQRKIVETELAAAGYAGSFGGPAGKGPSGLKLGLASIGSFLLNPATLITGGLIAGFAAYGKVREGQEQKDSILRTSNSSLSSLGALDGSSAAFRQAAQDMNAAAGEISKSKAPFYFDDDRDNLARAASGRSDTLLWLGRRAAAEEQFAAAAGKATAFGSGAIETVDQLARGFAEITENGGTALTAYNALSRALNTPPPPEGTQYFTRGGLRTDIIAAMLGSAGGAAKNLPELPRPTGPTGTPGWPAPRIPGQVENGRYVLPPARETDPSAFLAQLPLLGGGTGASLPFFGDIFNPKKAEAAKQVNAALRAQMDNLDPTEGLSNAQLKSLVNTALDSAGLVESLGDDAKAFRREWRKGILASLAGLGSTNVKGAPRDLLNDQNLSRSQINQLLNPQQDVPDGQVGYEGLLAYQQQALSAIPKSDDGTQLEAVLRHNLRDLQRIKRRASGGSTQQLELELSNAESAYREVAVANAEDLRLAAESRATSNKGLRAIRLQFAKISFAAAGNDRNQIEQLMESMDRQTIRAVIEYQRTAVATAKAALQHAKFIVAQARRILRQAGAGLTRFDMQELKDGAYGANTSFQNAQDNYNSALDTLDAYTDSLNSATVNDDKAELPGAAGKSPEDLAAERKAKAEARLNEAIAALSLSGDITDPVEQARDALRAARMRYNFEKTNANLVEVRQSEAALEKAKWDQRLSDMQTAEQLGRISYATYIRYLENESDRMHKMNHKTRQQIDHMNQIDLALKEATASMEGQFNLGDIDTKGFVYAVRRMAGGGGRNGVGEPGYHHGGKDWDHRVAVLNQQHVEFHGADERTVRRILKELMGGAQVHTTASRKT